MFQVRVKNMLISICYCSMNVYTLFLNLINTTLPSQLPVLGLSRFGAKCNFWSQGDCLKVHMVFLWLGIYKGHNNLCFAKLHIFWTNWWASLLKHDRDFFFKEILSMFFSPLVWLSLTEWLGCTWVNKSILTNESRPSICTAGVRERVLYHFYGKDKILNVL